MDSSWATICGGAMWQSSSSSAAITQSSQLQLQDSPNLMLNYAGHNFYRHAMPESSSLNRKVMLEPSFPVTSSSCNLTHADQGNSFISFLTGPPSVLQYDTQHSKPFIPSSNVSDINSSSIFAPPRKGASIAPSFISLQNHDNRYLKIGGTCPVVSSRMVANGGQSSSSCSANVNCQSSELEKVVNHQRYHDNEQVKGFSSLSSWKLTTPSPRDIDQPHCTNSQASTRVLEGKSLSCQQSSSITTDYPRVFCLYASGALLLSNTGILGVRCSCHGLHMSISKFSEHSGLLDVNPGHAVHVDSGETIAQWRKVYFQQFGIRIPDDHCGWDWPEGFSAAAGVVKSKGSMPGTLRSAALSNVVGYYGDDTAPWNDLTFKNNHDSGHKLVNEVIPYKTRVNAQDNGNFLNRFIGTAQSNVQALAANQIAERYMLACSPVSNLASPPENVSQSDPAYFASISKRENAFASLTSMSKEKNLGRDGDDFKFHNLKSVDILDRTIVSSNIELRLGQPSQQNQTLNANVSAFDTHVISAKDHPQKSLLMEPSTLESSARVTDKSREYLNSAAYTARSSTTREPSKINFVKHAAGVYSARSSVRSVQFNDVAARGSSISMFLSNIENPSNGILQSNQSSNMVNGSFVMPKKSLCGSLTDKCNPTSHPCMKGKIMEAKTGGHATSSAHIAHEVNLRCPPKSVGTLTSSYVVRETSNDACFGICDKSSHLHQVSAMPADGSDGRITFKNSEKTSRVRGGYDDHGFLRSVNSLPLDSGPTLLSQTISSSITSLAVPSITTTSTNREGITSSPCLMNEKLQILAVGEVMENSNQDQAITYLGINQNQGSTYNSFCSKVKSSIAIPSKSGKIREETNLRSKEDAPELAMESTNSKVICQLEGDFGKSAHISVLEFSAATEEKSLCLGDTAVQYELLHYPSPTAQPSIRLGGSEKHIGPSCDHVKSCQRIPYAYVQDKCNCVAQQNCLDRNCDFKSKRSLDGFREEDGNLNGCTSIFASNTNKDCTILKDKATSVGQIGELLKPNLIPVERNAFQWKDVPCKTTVIGKVMCKDRTPELLDGRKTVEDHTPDPDSKCCNRSAQGTECIKEQEVSNISSKCSAPAITQTSVRVSIEDSCTDGARGSNCANNHVVDQGSGIEKCWSSDDAPDSGTSTQFDCFSSKSSLIDEGSSEAFPDRSSRSLIDELRLRNSLTVKKVRTEVYSELTKQKCEIHIKSGKRKRATKWKRLNESFYASAKSSDNDENPKCMGSSEQEFDDWEGTDMLLQPSQGRSDNVGTASKRGKSRLSSVANGFRGLHRFCHNRGEEIDCQMLNTPFDDCIETPKSSHGERFKSNQVSFVANQILNQKAHCTDTETTTKCNSVNRAIVSSNTHLNVRKSIARPIVCGTYGIISNGNTSKAVKILSLGKILRNTRRCTHGENSALELSPSNSIKNTVKQKNNCNDAISTLKKERIRVGHSAATWRVSNPGNCVEVMEMACPPYGKNADEVSYMMEKGRHSRYKQSSFVSACSPNTSFKSKSKEVRKRSLYELTTKGKDSSCASFSGTKHLDCVSETKCRYPKQLLKKAKVSNDEVGEAYSAEISNGQESKPAPDSDAFCCVCGNSNNDNTNYLLECSGCLIMVHQACYGISSVPKFHWYCRPCKTSSKNIVCVLCGYRGGAMTRALQSQNIVRSLLDAWNSVTESRPENSVSPSEAFEDRLNTEGSSKSYFGGDAPSSIRPAHMESSLAAMCKEDLQKELHAQKNSSCPIIDSMVHNSITAGVADSTVKQWVHMVCGLWTPGTRCPNVDTMNAFDVSGVSFPKENVVCSICNCLGGSCIRCRVMDCSIHFHPWCAHQKGLLQSEVEGADNEKVGFYGRCELHSTQPHPFSGSAPRDSKSSPGQKYLTCARIEAYEGRKQEGSRHSIQRLSNGTAGCHVPQEQLNAWNHINGQKAYARGLPKMPVGRASEVETDCRKEYTRYKQLKSWKHLVVYKSGIHALGLYTSSFISRGAMVVEYVGEIVGLRVADRRENDYQSGKKLQYKSACYFFRIDKEHIIDATCKGGIARFVNHSCQPNCVAKVITVRNEKKVVFFAERDVYPGEEITYDYHFNREDEGKKIPCLCNAKNCRRYLN